MVRIDFAVVFDSNLQRVSAFELTGNHVEFHHVEANHANFSFAFLPMFTCQNCEFISANLYRASLRDGLIADSNFSGADLTSIVLSGTMLGNTKMENAKLKFANFDGTTLSGVSFSGSDLVAANLSSVVMSGENLWKGARFDDDTRLPFGERLAIQRGMIKVPPATVSAP